MRTISKLLLAIGLWGFGHMAIAQNDSTSIAVKTRWSDQGVLLRWSAPNANAWECTNQSGFRLVRYTISRDGLILKQPEKVELAAHITARPLEEWAKLAVHDTLSAIVAQALYGQRFDVAPVGKMPSIVQLVNISRERDQRFLTSMMVAETNFETALAAGWGYIDKSARNNEEYLYRVYPADTTACPEVGYGYTIARSRDRRQLPKITYFRADAGDRSVMLSWGVDRVMPEYSTYRIERSDNQVDYAPVSRLPITNGGGDDIAYLPDSLPENNRSYWYRIAGVNAFGEQGPWSDPIEAVGQVALTTNPAFTEFYARDHQAFLQWTIDPSQQAAVAGVEIEQSPSNVTGFKTVKQGIGAHERSAVISPLMPSNYFKIVAIDAQGGRRESFPVLVQEVDSIPPARPSGLRGSVDSTGLVSLEWNRADDNDTYGYRLLRSDFEGGRMFVLNDIAVQGNHFTDTVNLDMMNRRVYYAVVALDNRYNPSEPSDTIALEKPDRIPPSAPVFKRPQPTADGIRLTWTPSSSEDAATTRIYRSGKTAEGYDDERLVAELPTDSTSYTDTATSFGETYAYRAVAVDEAGNLSDDAGRITARAITRKGIQATLKTKLQAGEGIWLIWKIETESNIAEIVVYRGTEEGKLTPYKSLDGTDSAWLDRRIQTGNTYYYRLRIVPQKGVAVFSDMTKVVY